MTIVAKFGGSSMADAQCMRRSAGVAAKQENLAIVVVSATYGTTNNLIKLANVAENETWVKAKEIYKEIESKHLQIAKDLRADDETLKKVRKLLNEAKTMSKGMHYLRDCSAKAMDSLYSVGERLSSTLFALAMQEALPGQNVKWLDARTVLKTDDFFGRALPNLKGIEAKARKLVLPELEKKTVFVTQGFIGSTEDGLTTTLGRGGSDYSAALFAEGIHAKTLQIWTDVAGIATTDPRLCADARPIDEISFTEAAELATFGAKILHPTTVWPAMRKEISVFVGSSYESEERGTWIKPQTKNAPLVRAIALRKDQSILTISTPRMVSAYGYLADIFNVFKEHKVSVDLITTSEISVSITVESSTVANEALIADLKALGNVDVESGYGLVSLIGNNINHTSGLANKILDDIQDINVRLVCSGASKHNFCFLVDNKDGPEVVSRLHKRFLS